MGNLIEELEKYKKLYAEVSKENYVLSKDYTFLSKEYNLVNKANEKLRSENLQLKEIINGRSSCKSDKKS